MTGCDALMLIAFCVIDGPSDVYLEPNSSIATVPIGSSFQMVCHTTNLGFPTGNLAWFSRITNRLLARNTTKSLQMRLHTVERLHTGHYTCIANNEVRSKSISFYLLVQGRSLERVRDQIVIIDLLRFENQEKSLLIFYNSKFDLTQDKELSAKRTIKALYLRKFCDCQRPLRLHLHENIISDLTPLPRCIF